MKHRNFYCIIFLLLFQMVIFAQSKVSGKVISEDKIPINKVQIYDSNGGLLSMTDINGEFDFFTDKNKLSLIFYVENFQLKELNIQVNESSNLAIILNSFSEELTEIQIKKRKAKVFE